MNNELRGKVDSCIRTAEEFTRLYYASIDNRRHKMSSLYLDNAIFVWNGNGATGKDMIHKYFIELPSSKHTLSTLDAQPLLDDAVGGQLTYILMVGGSVVYQDRPSKIFQQTFIITAENDKWRIASDCYRLQDSMMESLLPNK